MGQPRIEWSVVLRPVAFSAGGDAVPVFVGPAFRFGDDVVEFQCVLAPTVDALGVISGQDVAAQVGAPQRAALVGGAMDVRVDGLADVEGVDFDMDGYVFDHWFAELREPAYPSSHGLDPMVDARWKPSGLLRAVTPACFLRSAFSIAFPSAASGASALVPSGHVLGDDPATVVDFRHPHDLPFDGKREAGGFRSRVVADVGLRCTRFPDKACLGMAAGDANDVEANAMHSGFAFPAPDACDGRVNQSHGLLRA